MFIYSEGQSMVPSLMPSMTSWGSIPSTVQPTDWAVPSTSFIVPENSLAIDRGAITRAAAMTSSMEMLPLCWMFFTFLRSLGGSFKALPVGGCLGNVISNLLGRQAQRSHLGGKGAGG